MTQQPSMRRSLRTADAVWIGLGSMLGAGVFAVFPAAARSAGSWLLLGLVIAGAIATTNALSSASLAAQYPTSGGTYIYGRKQLGDWWGFAAGWSFVVGKTASLVAMALTFATYAVPEPWRRPAAAIAVAALTAVNIMGVTRTAKLAKILVLVTLAALAVSVGGLVSPPDGVSFSLGAFPGVYEVLQSAALLFFAFAGYARIATMGEEIREPRRTIPRAIAIALMAVLVIYALLTVVLLLHFPADELAATPDPLAAGLSSPLLAGIVRVGAVTASLGALLALIAGVSRTALAMARERDLPGVFGAVHPRFGTPHRAEVAVGIVVIALVLIVDLRGAIGFSSFGVLLYYAIANASAFTQDAEHRQVPRAVAVFGLVGCLVLAATVPWLSLAIGAGVLAVGILGRAILRPRDPASA